MIRAGLFDRHGQLVRQMTASEAVLALNTPPGGCWRPMPTDVSLLDLHELEAQLAAAAAPEITFADLPGAALPGADQPGGEDA